MKSPLISDPTSMPNRQIAVGDMFAGELSTPGSGSIPGSARVVCKLLERLKTGTLHLTLPDRRMISFGSGAPMAHVRIHDWAVFDAVLSKGDIGFAEGWISRAWTSPNLIEVIDLLVSNRQALEEIVYGSWWGQLLYRLKHALNRNNRTGSRRNIHAHYDLGNEFYSLWLDAGMTYSSALFEGDFSRSLEAAQEAKYRRLFEQSHLVAGNKVLEIGCGWGGFAQFASERGAAVTGLTISKEQLDYARHRLEGAQPSSARPAAVQLASVQLLLQDYRDHQGTYDAVVSIEMFEAVGEKYWPSYFETVSRCLKPGGRASIQSIVIAEDLFERYRRSTDFIQQYVFPGGMLPSRSKFIEAAERAGLQCVEEFTFGADYAQTLKRWRHSFMEIAESIQHKGFDQAFARLWEFYLAYCESAFRYGNTDVVHFTLQKPEGPQTP